MSSRHSRPTGRAAIVILATLSVIVGVGQTGTDEPAAGLVAPTSTPSTATAPKAVSSPAAVVTAPPPAAQLGFFPGDSHLFGYNFLEAFLGHSAKYVVQMADTRSVSQFEGSVWGEVVKSGQWQTVSGRLTFVLSVPLTIGLPYGSKTGQRAALQATASGANDFPYRLISQYLKQGGYPDAIIRLGYEFDGDWMPWSAKGNEALWVSAYRRIHDIMHAESPTFRFDWNGDPGYMKNETAAYPGDGYVDIIGLDIYDRSLGVPWNSKTQSWTNPPAAFNTLVPGLTFQRDFAIAHHKQVSYPEWALSRSNTSVVSGQGGDDPAFVRGMYNWMNALPRTGPGSLAYHAYFNADIPNDGYHRLGNFPSAAALFRTLFGAP